MGFLGFLSLLLFLFSLDWTFIEKKWTLHRFFKHTEKKVWKKTETISVDFIVGLMKIYTITLLVRKEGLRSWHWNDKKQVLRFVTKTQRAKFKIIQTEMDRQTDRQIKISKAGLKREPENQPTNKNIMDRHTYQWSSLPVRVFKYDGKVFRFHFDDERSVHCFSITNCPSSLPLVTADTLLHRLHPLDSVNPTNNPSFLAPSRSFVCRTFLSHRARSARFGQVCVCTQTAAVVTAIVMRGKVNCLTRWFSSLRLVNIFCKMDQY